MIVHLTITKVQFLRLKRGPFEAEMLTAFDQTLT
jgi:hypothetical protein